MDLNKLIEQEGLERVSEKTNISIFNLISWQMKILRSLNRVKGFKGF